MFEIADLPVQARIDWLLLLAVPLTLIGLVIVALTRKPFAAPLLSLWAWFVAFVSAAIAGYGTALFGVGQRIPPIAALPEIFFVLIAASAIGMLLGVVFALVPALALTPFQRLREALREFFAKWFVAVGIVLFLARSCSLVTDRRSSKTCGATLCLLRRVLSLLALVTYRSEEVFREEIL
jgi:hypothetical protein